MEQRIKTLKDSKRCVDEEDLVLIFIMGLNGDKYGEKIADLRARKGSSENPNSFSLLRKKYLRFGEPYVEWTMRIEEGRTVRFKRCIQ
jgi:hypothetical protein